MPLMLPITSRAGVFAWSSLIIFFIVAAVALSRFGAMITDTHTFSPHPEVMLSPAFLTVCVLYLTSHLMRSLRLMTLLLETERSFFRIFRLHMATAWVGLLLPFKLGDAYRMIELSHNQHRAVTGPFVVVLERFFDGGVLLGLAAMTLFLTPGILPEIELLIVMLLAVVAVGVLSYWMLPGFIDYVRSLVIRRSHSQRGYNILQWLQHLDRLITESHKLIHGRILALLVLSLGIWGVEWGCVALLRRYIADAQPEETWLPALLKVFTALLTSKGDATTVFPFYGIMVFWGLSVLGFPLWLAYARQRIQDSAQRIAAASAESHRYRLMPTTAISGIASGYSQNMSHDHPPLTIVFDNRAKVGEVISAIVGPKRYGDIIHHRRPMKDHAERLAVASNARFIALEEREDLVNLRSELQVNRTGIWVYWKAQAAIVDHDALIAHLNKVHLSRETLVSNQSDPLLATFPSSAAFDDFLLRVIDEAKVFSHDLIPPLYVVDLSKCLLDMAEPGNFMSFFSGSSETRFFNQISGDQYVFVKSSTDKRKIRGEYQFYHLLPPSMQRWFILPYDFKESDQGASYTMERVHMPDAALLWIHSSLSESEFKNFIDRVLAFVAERPTRSLDMARFRERQQKLYFTKVRERFTALSAHPAFERLNQCIEGGTSYADIATVMDRYYRLYSHFQTEGDSFTEVIGHGDLCFSNMLYDKRTELLKFIDPKGANSDAELWTDPLYDLAKLSHSILGLYDFINNDRFFIQLDPAGRLELNIMSPSLIVQQQYFLDRLSAMGYDVCCIRLYEASLFLSMLPLHIDHPRKVIAFILNAIHILDELEKNHDL